MREKVSAPITSARLKAPLRSSASAVDSAKTKPEQTACRSKAAPWTMPRPACTVTAVAGKVWSGVEVASTIRSMLEASTWALISAARAACSARSEVSSPAAAMWRSRMPVRCTIHSSVVSTERASSSLLRTRAGR
jgi:hypothetical protein